MTYIGNHGDSREKEKNKMLLTMCLQNVKHISHVRQIKTTKTIRMGWHCTIASSILQAVQLKYTILVPAKSWCTSNVVMQRWAES